MTKRFIEVMKCRQGTKCCIIGATLASVSWSVIFYLYVNIDVPNDSHNEAKLKHVPHKKFLLQRHPDSNQGKEQEERFVDVIKAGQIFTDEDKQLYDHADGYCAVIVLGIRHHAFNAYLSNRLSFERPILDTRDMRCSSQSYYTSTEVSIIMCFYNEASSVLLRSLHSIFGRTTLALIKEIILVDDCSEDEELKAQLGKYIEDNFPPIIRLLRNNRREGLIRSRMIGAKAATGEVLVFLDSHIEVNAGWLEPLISRVLSSRSTVVLPVIDIIDADTFQYKKSPLVRGGFTWSMRFSWEAISESYLRTDPFYIRSPTMAGGLLSINREYFFQLGGYDTGMDIWGGENLEMSFRVWMCGGKIEIATCSRVGHVFRKVRPYSSPDGKDTMTKNTLRMVNVWLDDYKDMYNKATNNRYVNTDYGDIQERLALRKSLKCWDFKWYLDEVFNPDFKEKSQLSQSREDNPKVVNRQSYLSVINKGKLRLSNTNYCVMSLTSSDGKLSYNSPLVLGDCGSIKLKWYELQSGGFLIDGNKCLDVASSLPIITKCTGEGGTQQWLMRSLMNKNSNYFYNPGVGLCLHAPKQQLGVELEMSTCNNDVSKFMYDTKVVPAR
ncbi:GALNT11 [Bugula neritina]|uniref:Polypeptide N-acetylgalactosaminyltransferase n=1 Tax=Bugula neritina TaxID=10212 RepID=A0A7J7JXR7_BUGNE|nr:GALNT11 [Bugula neritina]